MGLPVQGGGAQNPAVVLAGVAREAGLELIAQRGEVGVLPGRALTGLETYFWLEGTGPRQTQRSAAGFDLRIFAQPSGYVWDFGDGTVVRGGPGRSNPPRSSDVRHTYQRRGRYDIAVSVDWQVTFEVNGQVLNAPGTFQTVAAAMVPVDELRSRLTG